MNQNLMNPEIVMRSAREREMDLRREMRGVREAELEAGQPARRKARAHSPRRASILAWIFAAITR